MRLYKNFGAKMVFYLALGKNDTFEDVKKVRSEAEKYDDIILGDFLDSPLNITFKTIAEYTWLHEKCTLDYW